MAKANTKKTTPTVNHPTTPEEKKKALDTAMEQIIKNYGQGAVMFLGGEGNKKLDVESVPTGSIGLDYALGIGGLPRAELLRYTVRSRAVRQRLRSTLSQKRRSSAEWRHS